MTTYCAPCLADLALVREAVTSVSGTASCMAHAVLLSHPGDTPQRRLTRLGELRTQAEGKLTTASAEDAPALELLVQEYALAGAMDMTVPLKDLAGDRTPRPPKSRRNRPGRGERGEGGERRERGPRPEGAEGGRGPSAPVESGAPAESSLPAETAVPSPAPAEPAAPSPAAAEPAAPSPAAAEPAAPAAAPAPVESASAPTPESTPVSSPASTE